MDPIHQHQHLQQVQHPQHQRQPSLSSPAYAQPMDPSMAAAYPSSHHQQPAMYHIFPPMGHAPPLPLQHHHDPSLAHQQPMQQAHMHLLQSFWINQMHEIENVPQDFKVHHLPLARIKKVMKTDDDVKMISAEAPMIFDKGCDIFITELTLRAWIHAEENKRRTLQRSDIAAAIAKTDMFDFLIDIVPREEYKFSLPKEHKTQQHLSGNFAAVGQVHGLEHRRSQEAFQPMPGPGSAAGPRGPGGPAGGLLPEGNTMGGYSYPYGILEGEAFPMGPGGPEGIDPYQQQHHQVHHPQHPQHMSMQYMGQP